MRFGAEGIVTNEYNEALFILRDDSRTWAMPGGAVEAGELPTDAVRREVEEESGIRVLPVRLVGLYYLPLPPGGLLSFSFRCLQKGGQPATSAESPQAGFMKTNPPPSPMLPLHRERLHRAMGHAGGPPYWGQQGLALPWRIGMKIVYRLKDLGRALRREPAYRPPPELTAAAFTIIRNEEGHVLWVKRTDHDIWNLPGGACKKMETPWEAAVRKTKQETGLDVRLTDLSGVYLKPLKETLILAFTAEVAGGQLPYNEEAADFAYFAPGEEPANVLPKHVEWVADAAGRQEETVFRIQAAPSPDLAALAQQR